MASHNGTTIDAPMFTTMPALMHARTSKHQPHMRAASSNHEAHICHQRWSQHTLAKHCKDRAVAPTEEISVFLKARGVAKLMPALARDCRRRGTLAQATMSLVRACAMAGRICLHTPPCSETRVQSHVKHTLGQAHLNVAHPSACSKATHDNSFGIDATVATCREPKQCCPPLRKCSCSPIGLGNPAWGPERRYSARHETDSGNASPHA